MTDNTDTSMVDVILATNLDNFEFDNCGLDSIEDLLNGIDETDLYESVSQLPPPPPPPSGSLLAALSSDFPVIFSSNVPHGIAVPTSSVPSSPALSRSARHQIGQVLVGSDRKTADFRDSVTMTRKPSLTGMKNGHGLPSVTADIGNRHHRRLMAPGTSVELQTYVDNNPIDDNVLNFYHVEPSRNRPDKTYETLGVNGPQNHHLHVPGPAVRQVEFQPANVQVVHQRIQGNAPQSDMNSQDRPNTANSFHSDCLPNDFSSLLFNEEFTENLLENLMNDQEEIRKFLSQVVSADGGQLHQMLNLGSDGQSNVVQNQPHPTSSGNSTVTQNGMQAMSCYPDTPPESGSEAHSPPDNLPSMGPDVSSHGDVGNGSFSKMSVAPSNHSNLPPYHSNHLTAPGNVAGGTASPHHPVFIKAPPNQPAMTTLNPQLLLNECNRSSVSHKNKKRKHSLSPQNSINSNMANSLMINSISASLPVKPVNVQVNLPIKPEPVMVSDGSEDDTCGFENPVDGSNGSYQVIKWSNHLPNDWSILVDESGHNCMVATYRVDADKGFNFSSHDEAFVCQKKNHFQVTVHASFSAFPKFVRSSDKDIQPIDEFCLNFYGIKMESPNQQIKIEQSQSDRSKRPLHPVRVDFGSPPQLTTKAVIGRLHFSETTTNNMRKRGKPNPDQRYFQLVVSLVARCGTKDFLVAAQVSERIIVRASNPGQFDGDVDSPWSKGKNSDSIFHTGNVGINIENPDEALTVHGNIKLTGHVIAPSDVRAKSDLKQLDTSQQLKNISQINVYHYRFNEKFAKYAGLDSSAQTDTGVLAQEVSEILPDAVQEVGDVVLPDGERIEKFLVVNKDRIFIEGIGAVKELCKVTDKLEDRINEIEVMNKRLKKYGYNWESMKSTRSMRSDVSASSSVSRGENLPSPASPGKLNASRLSDSHLSRQHCRHQHRQNSAEISAKEEKGLCSNRVVQVIIIILVLIMALCLAAITTWIIIRDNLSSSDGNLVNPSPPPSGGNNSGITNTTAEIFDWTGTTEAVYYETSSPPRRLGGEPLLWPDCLPDICPVIRCCLPETTATMSYSSYGGGSISDVSETASPPTYQGSSALIQTLLTSPSSPDLAVSSSKTTVKTKYGVPYGIQTADGNQTNSPPGDSGLKSSQSTTTSTTGSAAQTNKFSLDPSGLAATYTSTTLGTVNGFGISSVSRGALRDVTVAIPTMPTGAIDNSRPEVIDESPGPDYGRGNFDRKNQKASSAAPNLSSASSSTTLQSVANRFSLLSNTTTSNKIGLGSTRDSYPRYNIVNQSVSSNIRVFLDRDRGVRGRRFIDTRPQLPLAEIRVKLGNETRNVTTDYCFDDDCKMQQGASLFYQIPIGSTFPWSSIQIEFVVNSVTIDKVKFCNSSYTWNCNSTSAEEIVAEVENSSNEWILPVGKFLRSTYAFRIPLMQELIDDVCQTPYYEAEVKFREYIIAFARECSIHGR